ARHSWPWFRIPFPCFSSARDCLSRQIRATLFSSRLAYGPLFLPRPLLVLGRDYALAAFPLENLVRLDCSGPLPRGCGRTTLVAAGRRNDSAERLLHVLGPPLAAPRWPQYMKK